jgi:hypothetical protein
VHSERKLTLRPTVVLVAVSPESAKPAWWTMTTTAMGLAIASFATGALRSISLLDAVVVSYLLVLPLITTAYAIARLTENQRVVSPLLVVVDTVRFLLTSAFGLWIWASAPHFGSQPECNSATNFVLLGIRMSATSVAARAIGLTFWASYLFIFLIRCALQLDTLVLSLLASFSMSAAGAFRRPRRQAPADKVIRSSVRLDLTVSFGFNILFWNYPVRELRWAAAKIATKRPTLDFHSPPSNFLPAELMDSPAGAIVQRIFLAIALSVVAFVVIMTELELSIGNRQISRDASFGFGQVRFFPIVNPLFCP